MSRYILPAHDATLVVAVGWDNPLQTFFGQVTRPTSADEDNASVAWVGTESEEITTVADLCTHLHPYTDIPPALRAQLTRDQARRLPPSALQARMVALLAQLEQETGGIVEAHMSSVSDMGH